MGTIDWFGRQALYIPDKIALVEVATGRRITYSEFNAQANRAANWLESVGIRPGDRVAVLSGNRVEVLLALFGATKLGAVFVPLNFRLASPELLAILLDCEPSLIVVSDEHAPTWAAVRPESGIPLAFTVSEFTNATAEADPTRSAAIPVDLNAPQMLIYTSGTTGKPKGAILSHRMGLWNAVNFAVRDLMPTDTVLVHTPMFYTGGLNVVTLPGFFLGATVVLMPGWDTERIIRTIEQERVTVFFAVPTQFHMMVQSALWNTADFTSVRYMIGGGASMPAELIEAILARGLRYKQGFGLTEVGVNCFALEARDVRQKPGSIGHPNFCIEARVVDDDDNDVPQGDVGELVMRTPAMCDGYWRNPEATAEAIRNGWFHTGDLVRCDEDGYFFVVDRKKDMFISGGENVYPAEIENVLATHPAVAQVAVVGIPDRKWGEVGCAVVVLNPGATVTADALLEYCRPRLAKYKVPKTVVFEGELPRTHSGKVQKKELKGRLTADVKSL